MTKNTGRCQHHDPDHPFFDVANEKDRRQDQRLSEGMCPNRCGPMKKTSVTSAVCGCCRLKWVSMRVAVVWGEKNKMNEDAGPTFSL
jgi:hypothetical protein